MGRKAAEADDCQLGNNHIFTEIVHSLAVKDLPHRFTTDELLADDVHQRFINLIRKRRPFRGVFIHPWLAIY